MNAYLDFAKQMASQAGTIMKEHFALDINVEWKSDNTPLTVADTTINQLVIAEVKKRFPSHGVLGEEASYDTDKKYLWVVDPVDGTMPYSQGIPASVFSLALVEHGEPIVAVVQDPFSDRLYFASKGSGAFVNNRALHVNEQPQIGPQVFIDVAGHSKLKDFDSIKVIADLTNRQARVSKSFTAIYNALPVVTGQHAASIVILQYPWDGAAISLIATEAGGKVTDLFGETRRWDQNGDGFILSNGLMHAQLVDVLRRSTE